MPSITVRRLSEDIHRGLRIRAARRGRSMEAEIREILAIASGVRRPVSGAGAPTPSPLPDLRPDPRPDPRTGARVPQEVMDKLREILNSDAA